MLALTDAKLACIANRRHPRPGFENIANHIDPPRAPVAASAPPSRAKKLQLWAAKKLRRNNWRALSH
jgi:hypothetical protein